MRALIDGTYYPLLNCSCGPSAPKISCVVSLGCGVYPSAPLGNTDIAEALEDYKPKLIASRVKELLTMLVSTVGMPLRCSCNSLKHGNIIVAYNIILRRRAVTVIYKLAYNYSYTTMSLLLANRFPLTLCDPFL